MVSSRIRFLLEIMATTIFASCAPYGAHGQIESSNVSSNHQRFGTYTNPLTLNSNEYGTAVTCADPALIKERKHGSDTWYLYCTGDELNPKDGKGHLITQYRSYDLINWLYIGDAFTQTPAWVGGATSSYWAPAVKYFNNQYYLYYVAPNSQLGGSAIGVGTSASPAGPWIDSGAPVVAPENNPYNGAPGRAVIDPDVVEDDSGQRYISYGSYDGGISIRKLSADGLTSDQTSETQIAVDNYYEGGNFWKHNGYYYFFASSTNCCNGPLTGYSVHVGRAKSPLGPFLDRAGVPMTAFAPGGDLAIAANGNRWIGVGGNVVFADDAGQDYMLYHAIDVNAPYFEGAPGYTRRPALIDPIDWVDDWPVVRGGYFASDEKQPAPAAQPGEHNAYEPRLKREDEPGEEITGLSDEFNSDKLSSQWHFIHPQANNAYSLTGSAYAVQTQGPDETSDAAHVSILGEPVPASGDWMVETKVTSSVPFNNSCCYNYAQGALFIYLNDQNSIKFDLVPIWDTRVTEFGKQEGPVSTNYPVYGNQIAGTAGATTWLRIVRRSGGDVGELYTSYSSNDGKHWAKGGTWQHQLGSGAQIGIAAENTSGYTMAFDYVRVYRLKSEW
jgi:arabinan endo-1,5-alpha-L-arabinosidase